MTRRYIYIGVGILAAALAVFLCLRGEEAAMAQKPGPEKVLASFSEAMKTGDFKKAKGMCDTVSMQDYLDAYIHKWEEKSQKDSAAFASTVTVLSETVMEIGNLEEMDGVCFIDYTLTLDGNTRESRASLKKEKGEWKVAEITDVN
jgi:hypothetical protein